MQFNVNKITDNDVKYGACDAIDVDNCLSHSNAHSCEDSVFHVESDDHRLKNNWKVKDNGVSTVSPGEKSNNLIQSDLMKETGLLMDDIDNKNSHNNNLRFFTIFEPGLPLSPNKRERVHITSRPTTSSIGRPFSSSSSTNNCNRPKSRLYNLHPIANSNSNSGNDVLIPSICGQGFASVHCNSKNNIDCSSISLPSSSRPYKNHVLHDKYFEIDIPLSTIAVAHTTNMNESENKIEHEQNNFENGLNSSIICLNTFRKRRAQQGRLKHGTFELTDSCCHLDQPILYTSPNILRNLKAGKNPCLLIKPKLPSADTFQFKLEREPKESKDIKNSSILNSQNVEIRRDEKLDPVPNNNLIDINITNTQTDFIQIKSSNKNSFIAPVHLGFPSKELNSSSSFKKKHTSIKKFPASPKYSPIQRDSAVQTKSSQVGSLETLMPFGFPAGPKLLPLVKTHQNVSQLDNKRHVITLSHRKRPNLFAVLKKEVEKILMFQRVDSNVNSSRNQHMFPKTYVKENSKQCKKEMQLIQMAGLRGPSTTLSREFWDTEEGYGLGSFFGPITERQLESAMKKILINAHQKE